jgi:hypothetical protein
MKNALPDWKIRESVLSFGRMVEGASEKTNSYSLGKNSESPCK